MNDQNDNTRDFRPDYASLELNDRADWELLRANYRRLVHLWHPDRYVQRPQERVHAQTQFIELTKSYNNLRTFQREHGRLPFEPINAGSTVRNGKASGFRSGGPYQEPQTSHAGRASGRGSEPSPGLDPHDEALAAGMLAREPGMGTQFTHGVAGKRHFCLIVLGLAMVITTVGTFFVLDKKAQQQVLERGREVIRQAPASEFMPSASEIRRSEAKGAFVQPTK
jgi:hypothetical protein